MRPLVGSTERLLGPSQESALYVSTLALLMPFLQIGVSYYVSVAGLGCVLIIGALARRDPRAFFAERLPLRLAAATAMVAVAAVNPDTETYDVFRAIRQAIFLFAMTGVLGTPLVNGSRPLRSVNVLHLLIAGALLALVAMQTLAYQRGSYLGLPFGVFVTNANTLPDDLALKYSDLRPAATFGEPSYFAFYCVGLLYSLGATSLPSLAARPLNALVLINFVLCRSLLGMAGYVLVTSAIVVRRSGRIYALAQLFMLALLVVALLLGTDNPIAQRVANFGTQGDESTFGRIMAPIIFILDTLPDYPFGQSFIRLFVTQAVMLDNGLLGLIMEFGFVGFFVIAVVYVCARDLSTRVFMFIAMNQNGAFLSVDKLMAIAFFVGLYNANTKRAVLLAHREAAASLRAPLRSSVLPRSATLLAVAVVTMAVASPRHARARPAQAIRVVAASTTRETSTLADALVAARRVRAAGDRGTIRIEIPEGQWRIETPLIIDAYLAGPGRGRLDLVGQGRFRSTISGAVLAQTRALTDTDPVQLHGRADLVAVPFDAPRVIQPRDIAHDPPITALQLYQDEATLALARWPRRGFVRAPISRTAGTGHFVLGPLNGVEAPKVEVEPAPWFGGYWSADWAYEFLAAKASPDDQSFIVGPFVYDAAARAQVRVFLANSYSRFNEPGTYVLAPDGRAAYVLRWPDSGPLEVARAVNLLKIYGAADVSVSGLGFFKALGDGIVIEGASRVALHDFAVSQTGGGGVVVRGGDDVTIEGCAVHDVGGVGIALAGGNRATLRRANSSVRNCVVEAFGKEGRDYHPGVRLEGVGLSANSNTIRDGVASGVILSGNEILVADNDISNVLADSDDAGAIYMGRDFTQRGVRIVGNYIHDVGFGTGKSFVSGIYLDDQMSGVAVIGNIIARVPIGIVVGGGQDNEIRGNLIVRAERGAIHFDERGKSPRGQDLAAALLKRFQSIPTGSAPWRAAYPGLLDLMSRDPAAASGDTIRCNFVVASEIWTLATPHSLRTAENWVADAASLRASSAPPPPCDKDKVEVGHWRDMARRMQSVFE